jgi:hypothetical protein
MKVIASLTNWADAAEQLRTSGYVVSCRTPDGWIYKNATTFEFVKLEYASPFWHILEPENLKP